jgi:hypothetical protein
MARDMGDPRMFGRVFSLLRYVDQDIEAREITGSPDNCLGLKRV